MEFKSANEAPRDDSGTLILGDFGGNNLALAVWNNVVEEWVCAELQANMYQGKIDYYFEKHDNLKRWMPVP